MIAAEIYAGLSPVARTVARRNLNITLRSLEATEIIMLVTDHFKTDMVSLQGKSRKQKEVKPRQIAMYMLRNHTGLWLNAIGKMFNRDHSTVIYACETVQDLMDTDRSYRAEVSQLINELKKAA